MSEITESPRGVIELFRELVQHGAITVKTFTEGLEPPAFSTTLLLSGGVMVKVHPDALGRQEVWLEHKARVDAEVGVLLELCHRFTRATRLRKGAFWISVGWPFVRAIPLVADALHHEHALKALAHEIAQHEISLFAPMVIYALLRRFIVPYLLRFIADRLVNQPSPSTPKSA